MDIEEVKKLLPYGKVFSIYKNNQLIGIYQSNLEFKEKECNIIMNTTKAFDFWNSSVTIVENGNKLF